MKKIICLICLVFVFFKNNATTFTWTGSTSTAWNTTTNWSPNGLPDSTDNVIIVSTTNSPTLSQNRKVNALTLTSGTLNLNGFELKVKFDATFTSGTVQGGSLNLINRRIFFNGTNFNCSIYANTGAVFFNGGQFDLPVTIQDTGFVNSVGNGGCVFNDSLTIIHGGDNLFEMGTINGDVFNGPLKVTNNTINYIYLSDADTSYYNGNLILDITNSRGIRFGNNGGISYLSNTHTISIGSAGFATDFLVFDGFHQLGTTSNTLTLTGTATINIESSSFGGNLTVSTPTFLIKNSTFNGNTYFTRTGITNVSSYGGNVFNGDVTFTNNGTAQLMRLANNVGDTYNGDATFSSNGNPLYVGYMGLNYFAGDISIDNANIIFNHLSGKTILYGSSNQTLIGNGITMLFPKLKIDKSGNDVTLNGSVEIKDSLEFVNGKLITSSTNLLTFRLSSYCIGANNNSFVSGPVKKVGNQAFIFPVGKNNLYVPIEMTAPSNATHAFTAEYFNTGQSLGYSMDSPLKLIDNCNYWNFARTTGTSTPNIKLYWNSNGCILMDSAKARVANWNGSTWKNLGNGGITGNSNNGCIANSSAVVTWGNFTLAFDSCHMTAYTVSSVDTAKVRTLNGTAPYTYLWSSGGTDSTKLGLSAGTVYTVTVTDASGCTAHANYYKIFSKITGTPITSEANNTSYATWGDFDKDGDLDLFHSLFSAAPNNTNGNNFLFQNNCNGGLTRVTQIPGDVVTDGLTGGYSNWVDYDEDGDLDLYVGAGIMYKNKGNSIFEKVSDDIKLNTLPSYSPSIRGVAFADFNNDGKIDAYTGRNDLYVGNGDGNFTELSPSSFSVINTSTTRGDAVTTADYDNDDDMDIFIANSHPSGTNYLLRNDGSGTYTNITSNSDLTNYQGSYGCAWGDYDNDLDLDLFLHNNTTGNRLFRNDGSGTLTRITTGDVVSNSGVSQAGSAWADYDNDGDLDLFVPTFTKNFLFNNNGNGTFTKDVTEIVDMDVSVESYGAGWADYDNDGDLDLYVPTAFGNPNDLFYLNNLNPSTVANRNWLKLHCIGVTSNKSAIGARIYAKATINGSSKWQMREINSNTTRGGESGAISGNEIHMGFGNATIIDTLKIVWPASNIVQIFTNVDLNQFIEISEDEDTIIIITPCIADLPILNPGYVTGRIYRDNNTNCSYDPGVDYPIANKFVQAEAGTYFTLTNDSGEYVLELPAGNYNISTNMVPDNWILSSCQTDSLIPVTTIVADTIKNIDFSEINRIIPCNGTYNLTVTSVGLVQGPCDPPLSLISPCPGFKHEYCFSVENASQQPSAYGTIFQIELPNDIVYNNIVLSCFPSPVTGNWSIGTQTGNVLPITLINPLYPGDIASICIEVFTTLAATAPFNTQLDYWNPAGVPTNLIINGDFETCDNTGVTFSQYTYVTVPGVSTPGNYYVDDSPITIYNPFWSSTLTAHNGHCFLFADGQNLRTVWEQNVTVSPNTLYSIGYCVSNLLHPNAPPGVIPAVEVLINSAPQFNLVGSPSWNCYSQNWCSDINTSALVTLRANSNGNQTYGNDFGIDDIVLQENYGGSIVIEEPEACACDPNDKLVTPQGCGENGNVRKDEKLTYTIRFLNTGTGNAHKIVLRDKIDSDLDLNTLKIIAKSDSITSIEVMPDTTLFIEFDNIELEPDSMGFITYSISPLSGLVDGTMINNKAEIYFDANEVVITNETKNTLYDLPNPQAVFTYSHDCTNSGIVYDFSYDGNTPDNAIFSWEFENGSPSVSDLQNPNDITFSSYGWQHVTLIVERYGCTETIVDSILIEDFISNDSLLVCHDGQEMYIQTDSLEHHLVHGDCVGHCIEEGRYQMQPQNEKSHLPPITVQVLPNPVKESCNIKITGENLTSSNLVVTLVNLTGSFDKVIYSGKANIEPNLFDYQLNTTNMESGMYFVKISYGYELQIIKLLIQH